MDAAIDQPPRHDAEALRIEITQIDDVDGHDKSNTPRAARGGQNMALPRAALTPYFMGYMATSVATDYDHGDIMAAEIRLFPCLSDNFGYLIHDPATGRPPRSTRRKPPHHQGAGARGLDADRHPDHPPPSRPCRRRRRAEAEIWLPRRRAARQDRENRRCRPARRPGRRRQGGSLLARVLETPGHTLDHISYVFDSDKALLPPTRCSRWAADGCSRAPIR